MSNREQIKQMLSTNMGFQAGYIDRAFRVYEKNYGNNYNVEVITEIIVRLQNKDKSKKPKQSPSVPAAEASPNNSIQHPSPSPMTTNSPQHKQDIMHKPNQHQQVQQVNKKYLPNKNEFEQEPPPKAFSANMIQNIPKQNNQPKQYQNPLYQHHNMPPQQNKQNVYQPNINKNGNYNQGSSLNNLPLKKSSPFKLGDIVIFNGQKGEIIAIQGHKATVSYPLDKVKFSRYQETVNIQHLQKARKEPPTIIKKKLPTPPTKKGGTTVGKESHDKKFVAHITIKEADKLKLHDKIDHRDQVGRFVLGTIVEKQGSNLKIHYDGWSRKWDTWSDYRKEIHRFSHGGSISKRPAHRFKELKKSDYVDLNPSNRHPGWKTGEIRRLDPKSGQVQIVYECNDKNYLYWAHLDNEDEVAQFTTKTGTNQDGQRDVEQQIGKPLNNKQINNEKQYKKNEQQRGYGNNNVEDELEAFKRIRAKRFPILPNEEIKNPYSLGDWLEVQDTQTLSWITATVIDKENNWIVVHFDGWPSKYDQKIHAAKHKNRLRALGSALAPDAIEIEIKEEMEGFTKEIEKLGWKIVKIDADGNCLYRCFALEIYGDSNKHAQVRKECCDYMRKNKDFFQNFVPDFEDRMKEKEQNYEWGDHVDITALSELYNVRIRVFEYDQIAKSLYMSYDQGEFEETINLPLILLARHRKKHYNTIEDPNMVHKRPLGKSRKETISLRELRVKEEEIEKKRRKKSDESKDNSDADDNNDEEKNNEKNNDNDIVMNKKNSEKKDKKNISVDDSSNEEELQIFRKDLCKLTMNELKDKALLMNIQPPFSKNDLRNLFEPLVRQLFNKIKKEWDTNFKNIDTKILKNYWEQQFDEKNAKSNNMSRWISALAVQVPHGKYPQQLTLSAFNKQIGEHVADTLGSLVITRHRHSTIHASSKMEMAPMEVDNL